MTVAGGFLDAAIEIGLGLVRDAIWDDNVCVWLDWTGAESATRFQSVDVSLYDGLAGIACFLAELAQASEDRRMAETAAAAFRALVLRSQLPDGGPGKGLLPGRAGLGFALFLGGRLLQDRALMDAGLKIAAEFSDPDPTTEGIDLIEGSAGLGLAMLHLNLATGREAFAESAALRSDLVTKTLRESGTGQTGLSRGDAGLILFLARMAERLPNDSFADEIGRALTFESKHRLPKEENWRDLRPGADDKDREAPMWTWCHGAPGIALSRLALWPRRQEFSGVPQDLEWALRATQRTLSERRFIETTSESLCHGRLGNALILNHAGEVLDRADLVAKARAAADDAAQLILSAAEYRMGYGSERINLGLMTGSSGAGMAFLFFAGHRSEFLSSLFLGCPGIVI
ncbi:MAG: lanthionine synthetase LanC family protein [Planctomycetota bacterium]